jgi:predicted nucleic acid-binding protein
VDLNLVVDAAVISGIRNMSLADAIHMASARAAGATAFVTNDRRVRGSAKLEVVYLDELEAGVA